MQAEVLWRSVVWIALLVLVLYIKLKNLMNSVCVEYQSYNRMMSLVLCAWGVGWGVGEGGSY